MNNYEIVFELIQEELKPSLFKLVDRSMFGSIKVSDHKWKVQPSYITKLRAALTWDAEIQFYGHGMGNMRMINCQKIIVKTDWTGETLINVSDPEFGRKLREALDASWGKHLAEWSKSNAI
jgi:hypothetical protein